MVGQKIIDGNVFLGIELGSTRIKACLTDDSFLPIASGSFEWENKFENGYFTYSLDLIHKGIKECYKDLKEDVKEKYGISLKKIKSIGISGMMHGYLAFDENDNLLVPFRTWRNTTCEEASKELSKLFNFNIPQRWSIAHLYQAILNGEEHLPRVRHITTLSGYIHYLLTGEWEIGMCEGSGMFPVTDNDYDGEMLKKFDKLTEKYNFPWQIKDILPKVKAAGEEGTYLSKSGALFLDESEDLESGIPVCPPEGDMGTGMIATNTVRRKTGNVSIGTSANLLVVLEKSLKNMYPEIDIVTTPDGYPVAMVHSNNGCSELDLWVKMFGEFASLLGADVDKSALYKMLYENAMTSDIDAGKVISYNFLADEPVAKTKNAKPLCFRESNSNLNLSNFFLSQLYSVVAVLKMGADILSENEDVSIDKIFAHGGLFKVKGVAQKVLANALSTPVSVSETAGEGGAWGMALLAAFMTEKGESLLPDWLDKNAFGNLADTTIAPDTESEKGFSEFFERYEKGLSMF